MALYSKMCENAPLLGRIKLGTTELSNGTWGVPLCSCSSPGLFGLTSEGKLHIFGYDTKEVSNEKNDHADR